MTLGKTGVESPTTENKPVEFIKRFHCFEVLSERASSRLFFCYSFFQSRHGYLSANEVLRVKYTAKTWASAAMLFALFLLLESAGCAPPSPKSIDAVEKQALVNNSKPIAADAIPSDFKKVQAHLFAKPLARTQTLNKSPITSFEKVSDCGIDFVNVISRENTNKYLQSGSGVALGDYDGDGLVDVYLTGSDISNRLYKNLGDFKFRDVTDAAKVDGRVNNQIALSSGASFADVDNDGDLDLYVCNMLAPNLLYINQNDGTFKDQTLLRGAQYTGASKQASFCDYDRDGDLDFYLLTHQDELVKDWQSCFYTRDGQERVVPGKENDVQIIAGRRFYAGESDYIFQNQGDGTFRKLKEEVGLEGYDFGLGCVWLDYNDDGWQDIYVGSDFKQPDRLYRNNQDGTFTDILPKAVSRTPWFSMGVDAADINNDGLLDIMIGDMAGRNHYDQKVNMGSMGDETWFLNHGMPRQFMKNCLFLNSGAGHFLEAASLTGMAKSGWTWSIRIADLNIDGLQDVFVSNGNARDSQNSDLLLELANAQSAEMAAKLTKAMPIRKDTNLVFANLGGLEFQAVERDWGLDHKGISHAVGFADLDLDGDLDCVVNNYYEPSLIYRNESSQGARLLLELRCNESNFFGIGSKVEVWQQGNYQRRDLVPSRGYQSSDPMVLHFGFKNDADIERLKVTWPDGKATEFSNLETGYLYRVIEPNQRSVVTPASNTPIFVDQTLETKFQFVHHESTYDDYEREPLLPFQLSRLGGSIACGDINGDGFVDIYCGGAAGQAGKMFVNRDGEFQSVQGPWDSDAQCEDMSALFFDADGDGNLDLYVASGGNEFDSDADEYQDRLYRNLGNESFENVSATALPNSLVSSQSVASVDFDRDGDLDLFVGSRSIPGEYPLTPKSQLLINEDGAFRVAQENLSGGAEDVGLVNSAVWSDFDSDGWPDLLVAAEWGPISVFRNDQGRLVNATESVGLGEQFGWWHGITAADLDGDGDMDYVVTNQGRNTKYHATAEHPHRLYYDDFDGNGTVDLVEAEYEGSVEYPVRGRSCSSRCMPFIADKFKTFHDFSLASISDIYQVQEKPRPFRELRILDSVVLWNERGSSFRIEPLPRLAQISPGYGVCVSDFDSDGFQDILMATNFFGSQPETGYLDGGVGWLLKGQKNKQFKPCWPNESGVVVAGDGNGLTLLDVDNDGDQDAIFAINNQSFRLLKNQSEKPRVRVEVGGVPGNAVGIGTRFVLVGDQSAKEPFRQAFEISAGGSYLAQSSTQKTISATAIEKTRFIEIQWPDGTNSKVENPEPENGRLILSYDPSKE